MTAKHASISTIATTAIRLRNDRVGRVGIGVEISSTEAAGRGGGRTDGGGTIGLDWTHQGVDVSSRTAGEQAEQSAAVATWLEDGANALPHREQQGEAGMGWTLPEGFAA